jgi:phosphoglycolate phosphatase-like HAD superfamily hydrolase
MTIKRRIFLFDVNHTLINTAHYHTQALTEVEKFLSLHVSTNDARYITKRFDEIFLLMVAGFLFRKDEEWKTIPGGKKSYEDLVELIKKYQTEVQKEWGFIKKWSREVFLRIAADEIKVHLDAETIFTTGTIYWDTITKLTEPFEEAKTIVNYLTDHGYSVYLLTSSDGRLRINKGYFRYNDMLSGNYKRGRIETLRSKGLRFKGIVVGDPEDKPLPKYYKRAISEIEKDLGSPIDPEQFVMTGNSFEDDLETPMFLFNFGQGFLFDKKSNAQKEKGSNIYRINDLRKIKTILDL